MFELQKEIKPVKDELIQKLEEVKITRKHYKLLAVCGAGWLFDAMDVLILSYVIAAMIASGFVGRIDAGIIASSNNLGLFVGALFSGIIADAWGRKRAFQITLLIYSVFSFLSAFSWNQISMEILRFFTGFGLGGELPVVSSLLSEFIPSSQRGKFVVLLESFWAYGGLVAALVAYMVIPSFGWRIALMIGALPALYVWFLRRNLPESPRFLIQRGDYAKAVEVISYFGQTNLQTTPAEKADNNKIKERLGTIWSSNYKRRTAMLWILWFGVVFGYYGAFIWLPGSLSSKGLTLATSIYFSLLITAAQIPGYFTAALLIDKLGRKIVLSSFLILSALFALLFAFSGSSTELIIWGSLMSFFNLGAWGAMYAYTPENYPTFVRATGSGSASAFGRVGGIIAPYVIALALGYKGGFSLAYSINAVMFLIAAISVALLGKETAGKTLEQTGA